MRRWEEAGGGGRIIERKEKLRRNVRAVATSIELFKWPMEQRNPVADDEGRKAGLREEREREREKAQAPHPSNCSANYYAKISEILATHDQLFWPTLYIVCQRYAGNCAVGWMDGGMCGREMMLRF